jgi:hypothetical protein
MESYWAWHKVSQAWESPAERKEKQDGVASWEDEQGEASEWYEDGVTDVSHYFMCLINTKNRLFSYFWYYIVASQSDDESMCTDDDSNSDVSLPSFATLDLFWDRNDEEGGINIDNTIAKAQFNVLQGRAPLLSAEATEIRQRGRALLEVQPMGEEANPYKKRPVELSVEALDDQMFEDKEGELFSQLNWEGDLSWYILSPSNSIS